MINNSVLVGRLTKELDLKYTQSGKAVAKFTLAVGRSFKNPNGEYESDFINCQIWDKAAENLANYTRKGSLIGVEGRIQTGSYENQQGQRVYTTEVVVKEFQLLEPKKEQQNSGQNRQGNTQQNDPFSSAAQMDIQDDDLPF